MITGDVSWIAVFVAAIVSTAIGALWYSKRVLGTTWANELGWTPDQAQRMQKPELKNIVIGFVATLVMAFVLANIVRLADAITITEGVLVGFWVWLGFVATLLLGSILWEGRSAKLYAITAGYQLISLIVMAGILTWWG